MKYRDLNLPGSASEDEFHQSVAELLDWILLPPTFYTTFPAGYGKLGKAMAGKLKKKGMKAGMPDILVFQRTSHWPNTQVIGIELKAGRGTASAQQRSTHAQLQAVGIRTYVCRTLDEIVAALDAAGIAYRVMDRARRAMIGGFGG